MAINAPIQGTAADVMRLAMINVFDYLKTSNLLDDVRILLQVHDELVFEIKAGKENEVVPNLVRAMEGVLDKVDTRGVPLKVDVAKGPNWADMKEGT
jgi:DNA polymerase I